MDDLVLRWDARREDKIMHENFDNLWFGPFKISKLLYNNTFIHKNLDEKNLSGGTMNGIFLKHYHL